MGQIEKKSGENLKIVFLLFSLLSPFPSLFFSLHLSYFLSFLLLLFPSPFPFLPSYRCLLAVSHTPRHHCAIIARAQQLLSIHDKAVHLRECVRKREKETCKKERKREGKKEEREELRRIRGMKIRFSFFLSSFLLSSFFSSHTHICQQ